MTGIVTAALLGLFAWTNVGIATANAEVAAQEAAPEPTYPTYTVSMTGYNAVPEQTDSDPYTTASGAYSNPEIIAARSVDLADELPFGTIIEVVATSATPSNNCGLGLIEKHLGYRVIADSMHSRKRNQIDLLFDTTPSIRAAGKTVNPAVALGVCSGVEIRVVGKMSIKEIPKTQNELRLALGKLPIADEQNLAVSK